MNGIYTGRFPMLISVRLSIPLPSRTEVGWVENLKKLRCCSGARMLRMYLPHSVGRVTQFRCVTHSARGTRANG